MLKLGHPYIYFKTVSTVKLFPCSLTLFSMGILRWSQTGSTWSLSQLVCTKNQTSSDSSQQAFTPSVSLSITIPQLGPTPAKMKQTGADILSVLNLLEAAAQLVSSSRVFLTSQQVGMALFLITLIKSQVSDLAYLVSTFSEKAPCLMPVKVKTEAATESEVQSSFPSLQQSIVTSNFERSSHISKSRLRPCITVPSWFLTRKAVQAWKVENQYMKLQKKIFSKGQPLSLANASTSATKSWYLNSVRAQSSTPSQKVLGTGRRSMNYMKRVKGCMKSRTMGAHLTMGGSLRETLQTRGTWLQIGSRWGTIVAQAMQMSKANSAGLIIGRIINILNRASNITRLLQGNYNLMVQMDFLGFSRKRLLLSKNRCLIGLFNNQALKLQLDMCLHLILEYFGLFSKIQNTYFAYSSQKFLILINNFQQQSAFILFF